MKKVGLALSSGGARGFSHIGVIKVLKKHNINVECVAGTSMGALVAAYYALFLDVAGLEKTALSFRRGDLLKLIDFNDPRLSLVKGEKVKAFLKSIFGYMTFSDTKIPLKIGATSLQDGSKVIFSSGKIVDAVMASGAVPGVFPPVRYKGQDLVDGGLSDATPVEIVRAMGANMIVAVDLFGLERQKSRTYANTRDAVERAYCILMSKLSSYETEKYAKNIVVLRPKTGSRIQTFSFYNAEKNIRAGEIEAMKKISEIKKLLK